MSLPNVTQTLANRTIPRDAAVGTEFISSVSPVTLSATNVGCPLNKVSTVSGTLVPGYSDVYATSNPGLGIRFYLTSVYAGPSIKAPSNESPGVPPSGSAMYRQGNIVVVGPVQSGTLTSLPSMTVTYSGSCISTLASNLTLTSNTVITGFTCNLTSPTVAVTLPAIPQPSLTPVGSTGGRTAFSITINCSSASNVGITLTDAMDPSNRTTELPLSAGSTATGVALQLVRNSTPIPLGPDSSAIGATNQIDLGTLNGASTLPFSVQYVSTSTPTPGSVKSAATFTLSYH